MEMQRFLDSIGPIPPGMKVTISQGYDSVSRSSTSKSVEFNCILVPSNFVEVFISFAGVCLSVIHQDAKGDALVTLSKQDARRLSDKLRDFSESE